MKILLTAFDAFGKCKINPSLEAVKLIPSSIDDVPIMKLKVPTVFGKSTAIVCQSIDYNSPDAVLCIGQAGGRSAITPEWVAINLEEAGIPDNEGKQPHFSPVFPDGDAAFFSTLPVAEMTQAISKAGIKAKISYSAETFVGNSLLYGVLRHIKEEDLDTKAGFIHVPYIPEQLAEDSREPSMALEDIAKGIVAAIKAIIASLR